METYTVIHHDETGFMLFREEGCSIIYRRHNERYDVNCVCSEKMDVYRHHNERYDVNCVCSEKMDVP